MPADCGIDRSGVLLCYIDKLLLTEPVQRGTEDKKFKFWKLVFKGVYECVLSKY